MKHSLKLAALTFAIAASLSATAHAEVAAYDLDPVHVSAELAKPFNLTNKTASVYTITAEQIDLIQPIQTIDLLRFAPGVSVSQSGGVGQIASVSIRGASTAQNAVFINGLRIGSSTAGGASWAAIPAQLINSIEVVRGPAATAYGADALGGAWPVSRVDH